MRGEGPRVDVACFWMEKAQASLASARAEYGQGRLDFCANRLYYAAFYAVSAVLAARGQKYGRHSAVRAAFHRDFVKTGMVDVKFAKLYDRLFYSRQKADYEVFAELDPKVLEEDTAQVEEFLAATHDLLERELRTGTAQAEGPPGKVVTHDTTARTKKKKARKGGTKCPDT